jgi:hypothetical protein
LHPQWAAQTPKIGQKGPSTFRDESIRSKIGQVFVYIPSSISQGDECTDFMGYPELAATLVKSLLNKLGKLVAQF